jgi:hypothetical protein
LGGVSVSDSVPASAPGSDPGSPRAQSPEPHGKPTPQPPGFFFETSMASVTPNLRLTTRAREGSPTALPIQIKGRPQSGGLGEAVLCSIRVPGNPRWRRHLAGRGPKRPRWVPAEVVVVLSSVAEIARAACDIRPSGLAAPYPSSLLSSPFTFILFCRASAAKHHSFCLSARSSLRFSLFKYSIYILFSPATVFASPFAKSTFALSTAFSICTRVQSFGFPRRIRRQLQRHALYEIKLVQKRKRQHPTKTNKPRQDEDLRARSRPFGQSYDRLLASPPRPLPPRPEHNSQRQPRP